MITSPTQALRAHEERTSFAYVAPSLSSSNTSSYSIVRKVSSLIAQATAFAYVGPLFKDLLDNSAKCFITKIGKDQVGSFLNYLPTFLTSQGNSFLNNLETGYCEAAHGLFSALLFSGVVIGIPYLGYRGVKHLLSRS
jgi:hypothetical protein